MKQFVEHCLVSRQQQRPSLSSEQIELLDHNHSSTLVHQGNAELNDAINLLYTLDLSYGATKHNLDDELEGLNSEKKYLLRNTASKTWHTINLEMNIVQAFIHVVHVQTDRSN